MHMAAPRWAGVTPAVAHVRRRAESTQQWGSNMSLGRIGARVALALLAVAAYFVLGAMPALAAGGLKVCVPEKEGAALKTPKAGLCKPGFTKTELPSEEEAVILHHMKYEASGVGGKPTIRFSAVNVQLVNGEGSTETINGEGNLVVGYDEGGREQTGSHNLVLGTEQSFTSFGAVLAGRDNAIEGVAPYASIDWWPGEHRVQRRIRLYRRRRRQQSGRRVLGDQWRSG